MISSTYSYPMTVPSRRCDGLPDPSRRTRSICAILVVSGRRRGGWKRHSAKPGASEQNYALALACRRNCVGADSDRHPSALTCWASHSAVLGVIGMQDGVEVGK
jgi:hypothetical protein